MAPLIVDIPRAAALKTPQITAQRHVHRDRLSQKLKTKSI
jgi:hypothetical protein